MMKSKKKLSGLWKSFHQNCDRLSQSLDDCYGQQRVLVICLFLAATGSVESSELTKEWRSLLKLHAQNASSKEVWAHYFATRESIDTLKDVSGLADFAECLKAHKKVLIAALEQGATDSAFLLRRHLELVGSIRNPLPGTAPVNDLVDILLDYGQIGLASEAWAKIRAFDELRFAKIDRMFANEKGYEELQKILRGARELSSARYFKRIGDWPSVENTFENAAKSINALRGLPGLNKQYLESIPFTSPYFFYPDLARAKMEMGKAKEAEALIKKFFENQSKFEQDSKTTFEKFTGYKGRYSSEETSAMNDLITGGCSYRAEMVSTKLEATRENYVLTAEKIQDISRGLAKLTKSMVKLRSVSGNGWRDTFPGDAFDQRVGCIMDDFYATICAQLLRQGGADLIGKISEEWLQSADVTSAPSTSKLMALQSRAWAYKLQKSPGGFRENVIRMISIQEKIGRSIVAIGSEDQKIAWLKSSDPFSLVACLGDTGLLASVIIQTKGAIMDSIRQGRSDFNKDVANSSLNRFELQRLEKKMLSGYLSGSLDTEQIQTQLDMLKNRLFGGRDPSGTATTLEQVQQSMGRDMLYLDYFRYRSLKEAGGWEDMYGLLSIDALEGVKFFPLGEASIIDEVVSEILTFQKNLPTSSRVEAILKRAYDRLILPAEEMLRKHKNLIISPDSSINSVPFSILLDHEGIFLVERLNVSFAGSARDLIGTVQRAPLTGSALVVSNPAYLLDVGIDNSKVAQILSVNQLPFDKDQLPHSKPLPGSESEAQIVRAAFDNAGINIVNLESKEANENSVTSELNKGHSYLHLATHGYILSPTNSSPSNSNDPDLMLEYRIREGGEKRSGVAAMMQQSLSVSGRIRDRPLSRAMLALSSCQNTFDRWKEGKLPEPATDGLLSAAELTGCDLSNVYLAVLSACSSGAGEAIKGDGILGMRRAFIVAGCKNLVVTNWPLADSYPQHFFEKFYKLLHESRDAVGALNETQRSELLRIRHSSNEGLAAAVYKAGTFSIWSKR